MTKTTWTFAAVGLAAAAFVLSAVLLPAIAISRAAHAQTAAPAAAPALVAPAVQPTSSPLATSAAPSAGTATVSANGPVSPSLSIQSSGSADTVQGQPRFPTPATDVSPLAYPPTPRGQTQAGGYVRGFNGQPFHGRSQIIEPEQAAEVQQIAQQDGAREVQVQEAVAQYHAADNQADRDKLRGRVSELLQDQFALRQKRRMLEVEALETRLKKLREALSKRESAKQTIIDRRLAELLHDDDGLGWGEPTSNVGGGPFQYRSSDLPPSNAPLPLR